MSILIAPDFVPSVTSVLLKGPWLGFHLRSRVWHAFPDDRRLLTVIVELVWEQFGEERPDSQSLSGFLKAAIAEQPNDLDVRPIGIRAKPMKPRWNVLKFATTGKLAAWLKLPPNRLDWLADLKNWTTSQSEPKLRHYVCLRLPRRRGKSRLLEIPKPTLKTIQRRILHEILDPIPPHDAAHGFRQARSIVSYVQPHLGQRIVLRFDLRDFFASVTAARVRAIFRTAGYPLATAKVLAGLCTTRTPNDVTPVEPRWRTRHLPQGAPTSPALANLAAYRLDIRLAALAQKLGAHYTRYADDLAFSGDARLERAASRVQTLVAVIVAEEGFELNFRKTRFMRQGVCQQLAGVVVNVRANVRRSEYDELKAILHNCVRHGPASQNRAKHADFRRHLQGRIAHVKLLNPVRGEKLHVIFEQIQWQVP